jgi:hypothetical protein
MAEEVVLAEVEPTGFEGVGYGVEPVFVAGSVDNAAAPYRRGVSVDKVDRFLAFYSDGVECLVVRAGPDGRPRLELGAGLSADEAARGFVDAVNRVYACTAGSRSGNIGGAASPPGDPDV